MTTTDDFRAMAQKLIADLEAATNHDACERWMDYLNSRN
ncbi:hypothetical protein PS893_05712 [Pseudomonas fluorescens]|nr:hypothetical protein PS893_05712 [Pseudomonas fluorescens]VVP58344.1 hypothetical protein PS843_05849 [Pseudomonas fluorescens]